MSQSEFHTWYDAMVQRNWADAERIVRTTNMTPSYALDWACDYGWLEFAKWLVSTFPDLDIYEDEGAPLAHACGGGHMDVIKWLIYDVPGIDVHADNERAFEVACMRGRLKVAKWLISTFPDIKVTTDAFDGACNERKIDVMKWLITAFPAITTYAYNNSDVLYSVNDVDAEWNNLFWFLTFYTADLFWSDLVQELCSDILNKWRLEVEPRRRHFMANIAPALTIVTFPRHITLVA